MGILDNAMALATASVSQKVGEMAGVVAGNIGNSMGSFTKLAANVPIPGLAEKLKTTTDLVSSGQKNVDEADALLKQAQGHLAAGGLSAEQEASLKSIVSRASAAKQQAMSGLATAQAQLNSLKNSAAEATSPAVSAAAVDSGNSLKNAKDHIVTLSEPGGIIVPFYVLPEVVESHTNQYEAVAPAQFPGAFQKYKGSDSTQWTLNATLISRTPTEANENYGILNTLRGWKQPYFGGNTGRAFPGKLGAPPPVLQLKGLRNLIGPVPVVILTLNWNWPKDVDYIPTTTKMNGNFVPFPAVINVAITLVESYSMLQFNSFDLSKYRKGDLAGAYFAASSSNTETAPVTGRPRGGT